MPLPSLQIKLKLFPNSWGGDTSNFPSPIYTVLGLSAGPLTPNSLCVSITKMIFWICYHRFSSTYHQQIFNKRRFQGRDRPPHHHPYCTPSLNPWIIVEHLPSCQSNSIILSFIPSSLLHITADLFCLMTTNCSFFFKTTAFESNWQRGSSRYRGSLFSW